MNKLLLPMLLAAVLAAGPALAQDAPVTEPDNGGQVTVKLGRAQVVKAPWPVTRVSIASPEIADVQVTTPNQVMVLAQSTGTTDLLLWNADGEVFRTTVRVEVDVKSLGGDLQRLFPTALLQVHERQGLVTVSGVLRRAEDAKRLASFMETAGIKYVDMTSLAGVQQVQIKVRVAEANRVALRTLGVNFAQTGSDAYIGQTLGGNPNGITQGVPASRLGQLPFSFAAPTAVSDSVSLFAGFPDANLDLFLEALEENQYVRTLAEPTLVALSGEEASFLAGGEFPIPVVQDSGGTGSSITIEFKEFGVRLRFRPTVLGDGTIRMRLSPEVSALSDAGAVTIEGFSVPAITTRRAETTLEMKNGQTFALAGLIDQKTSARAASIPGVGNVPVLGAMFRSVRYQQDDTELVVLATVQLVEPLSVTKPRPLPGQLHEKPNAWELYMKGSIEGRVPAKIGPANKAWLERHGLDRLKGPGAWKSYDAAPMRPIPGVPAGGSE